MPNINSVSITGNLTKDPELRTIGSGTSLCKLRIANNTRRKVDGEWVDKPNYFSVTVWGKQAEIANQYLAKGRKVAIVGRLEWSEWEAKDGSGKREGVEIVANELEFLTPQGSNGNSNGSVSDIPVDISDATAQPPAAVATDDDIPF
jgi:single-strand DNA-binding protein